MGLVNPSALDRVTFEDFSRVVLHYCGATKFSGYQIKFIFKEVAKGLADANPTTLKGAYILMKDFKDYFYPGKTWSAEIESRRSRISADDKSDASSVSAAISTIMQGKTNADLHEARDARERQKLMMDKQRRD